MTLREIYEDLLENPYPPPDDDLDYWESGPPATWDDDYDLPAAWEEESDAPEVSDYNTWGNW